MTTPRHGAWDAALRARQVDFAVAHAEDRPGYAAELLSDLALRPRECVALGAYGRTYALLTRVVSPLPDVSGRFDRAALRVERSTATPRDSTPGYRFEGSAVPAPSRTVYSSARVLDAVVSVPGTGTHPTLEGAERLTAALRAVVSVTGDDSALLVLESPSPVPPAGVPPGAAALDAADSPPSRSGLRLVVTVPHGRARARVDMVHRIAQGLTDAATRHAGSGGFGLWVGDPRPGRRTGDVVQVLAEGPSDRGGPAGASGSPAGAGRPVELGYPVSIVGPSRDGSLRRILDLVGDDERFRVLACAAGIRDDLDFVHLLLAVPPGAGSLEAVETELRARPSPGLSRDAGRPPAVAIPVLLRHLGPPDGSRTGSATSPVAATGRREAAAAAHISGFQTLLGPPARLGRAGGADRAVVWLRWTTRARGLDLAVTIRLLGHALSRVVEAAEVERASPSRQPPDSASDGAPGTAPDAGAEGAGAPSRQAGPEGGRSGGPAAAEAGADSTAAATVRTVDETAAPGGNGSGAASPRWRAVSGYLSEVIQRTPALASLLTSGNGAAAATGDVAAAEAAAQAAAKQLRAEWHALVGRLAVEIERFSTIQEDGLVHGSARLSLPHDDVAQVVGLPAPLALPAFCVRLANAWRQAAVDERSPFLEIRVAEREQLLGHSRGGYL